MWGLSPFTPPKPQWSADGCWCGWWLRPRRSGRGQREKAWSAQLRPEQGPVIELGRSFDFRSSTEPPTQAHNLIISALIIRYNLFNYPPVEDLIVRFIRDCNRVYPLSLPSCSACPSRCKGLRPTRLGQSRQEAKWGKKRGRNR